jgi:hypothetical protein
MTTHYVQPKHSCTRKEVKLGLCNPFNDIEEYKYYDSKTTTSLRV